VGCYIWYTEEGTGLGHSPPRCFLTVPNVTAHPSMASVPITVLLHNDPLLCGFNKGLGTDNTVTVNISSGTAAEKLTSMKMVQRTNSSVVFYISSYRSIRHETE